MKDNIEPDSAGPIDALLAEWKREIRRSNRRSRIGILVSLAGAMAVTTIKLVSILGHSRGWWHRLPQEWEVVLNVVHVIAYLIAVPGVMYATRNLNRPLNNLVQVDDVRVVGPLFEALVTFPNLREEDQDRAIYFALERLLPRMQANDAALLTAKQRIAMYQVLVKKSLPFDHRQQATFRITMLKALEQIGDSAAVRYVETLAKTEGQIDYQVAVRKAAQACLPFLLHRAEQQRAGENLLRASGDPAVDHLLKPAIGVPVNDAQQLLRAGIEE